MSRALDPSMVAALSSSLINPVFLAIITFRSSTQYIWSGVGPLVFGGNNYLGVGSLGRIGVINEGVEVKADGTSVTLSGIDSTLLNDSLNDIQPGLPATLYFGLMSYTGTLIGTPYKLYDGVVDEPTVSVGADTISITINFENLLVDGQRASNRRYTSADQRLYYPTDTAFGWVESLNDAAFVWG